MAVEAVIAEETRPESRPESESYDRRSLRSRRMIAKAFAELIVERGLGSFTVGDLMDKADLNRSTFYAHYSDLDNLLAISEQEIIDDLVNIAPFTQKVTKKMALTFELTGEPPEETIILFDILREHGNLLRGLLSPQGDAQFQATLRDDVCANLIRSILHSKYTSKPNVLVDYYISYYASAVVGLIQHWLSNGMVEDSREMGRIMLTIMFLRPGEPIKLRGLR